MASPELLCFLDFNGRLDLRSLEVVSVCFGSLRTALVARAGEITTSCSMTSCSCQHRLTFSSVLSTYRSFLTEFARTRGLSFLVVLQLTDRPEKHTPKDPTGSRKGSHCCHQSLRKNKNTAIEASPDKLEKQGRWVGR